MRKSSSTTWRHEALNPRSIGLTVVLAAVLLLAAAACGSEDEDAAPAAQPEPRPTFAGPAPDTPTPPPAVAEATSAAQIPNRASVRAADKDESITPAEAKQNVGKNIKVCGTVEEIRQEPEIKEDPFLLNFDSKHPDVLFFALVRSAFQYRVGDWPANPETFYLGKKVCASGVIQVWRDIAFITAGHDYQLEVVE